MGQYFELSRYNRNRDSQLIQERNSGPPHRSREWYQGRDINAEIVCKLVWVVQALMGQTTRPFDNHFRIFGGFFVPSQYKVGKNASYCGALPGGRKSILLLGHFIHPVAPSSSSRPTLVSWSQWTNMTRSVRSPHQAPPTFLTF